MSPTLFACELAALGFALQVLVTLVIAVRRPALPVVVRAPTLHDALCHAKARRALREAGHAG